MKKKYTFGNNDFLIEKDDKDMLVEKAEFELNENPSRMLFKIIKRKLIKKVKRNKDNSIKEIEFNRPINSLDDEKELINLFNREDEY